MMNRLIEKILARQGEKDTFEFLGRQLSGSELNSLLLAVFEEQLKGRSPAELLRQYRQNRFVQPSDLRVLAFKRFELQALELIERAGFELLEAGPVAPLGTCSVLASVDQKKVISALRQTEVVADITNYLALEMAARKKTSKKPDQLHLGATHRHIRAQQFDVPGFTAHFKILSLVSGGRDGGDFRFETESLHKHLCTYVELLQALTGIPAEALQLRLLLEPETEGRASQFLRGIPLEDVHVQVVEPGRNNYYKGLQFKIAWKREDQTPEIIDGGLVDWTQQLLSDKKERLLISGIGLEYWFRLHDPAR